MKSHLQRISAPLQRLLPLALLTGLLTVEALAGGWKTKVPRDFASAILVEWETGQVLFEENPHLQRAPASTTKLMTALIVMEQIKSGRVSLEDSVVVSGRAQAMGGSQVFLATGEVVTLENLMKALIIASGNDAAVAIAEHVGGTYENFIRMMNQKVQDLNLKNTHFYNVHGLDDVPAKRNITSAYDLAQIARALLHYPTIVEWSSTRVAPFRNGTFTLSNTNRLLGRIRSLDGLKTGFTSRAGFCLVATGRRHGMRLISVILGSRTSRGRFRSARHLLESGFTKFSIVRAYREGEPLELEVEVVDGRTRNLPLVAGRDLSVVVPTEHVSMLQQRKESVGVASAPIKKGMTLGVCEILMGERVLARAPAVAPRTVPKASIIDRIWKGLGFGRGR
jgi:D-alanyl-D-alanine carboxypeptidase (penicillin-binding protein 5/6)